MITFDAQAMMQHIVIVGCGGTGSQIARSVARIVYDMRQNRMHIPNIILIDPDVIEAKNVGRQMFLESDIGQHKAYVLMRRFNMALGLNISAVCQPFDKSMVERWNTLVIGAVDNHMARSEINKVENLLWVDAGNHKAQGQVVIGNTSKASYVMRQFENNDKERINTLPNAALLFPGLLEPEPPKPEPAPDASCADLVATREQDLLINDWMSVVTSQYVYKLLHRQPISSFMTFIGADALAVRSVPINHENLAAYLRLDEEKAG